MCTSWKQHRRAFVFTAVGWVFLHCSLKSRGLSWRSRWFYCNKTCWGKGMFFSFNSLCLLKQKITSSRGAFIRFHTSEGVEASFIWRTCCQSTSLVQMGTWKTALLLMILIRKHEVLGKCKQFWGFNREAVSGEHKVRIRNLSVCTTVRKCVYEAGSFLISFVCLFVLWCFKEKKNPSAPETEILISWNLYQLLLGWTTATPFGTFFWYLFLVKSCFVSFYKSFNSDVHCGFVCIFWF